MPMPNESTPAAASAPAHESPRYERPTCEVVCLACEISAYAPEDDLPLF